MNGYESGKISVNSARCSFSLLWALHFLGGKESKRERLEKIQNLKTLKSHDERQQRDIVARWRSHLHACRRKKNVGITSPWTSQKAQQLGVNTAADMNF